MRRTIPAVAIAVLALAACGRETPLGPITAPAASFAAASGNGKKDVVLLVDAPFDVPCATQTLHGTINGFVQIRPPREGDRNVSVLNVNFLFVISNAAGESISWREVGQDHVTLDKDGNLSHAVDGRGGFVGVIGRLVFDETTGAVTFVAGKPIVLLVDQACAQLT